jgi:PadR family transcriptional regulator PadR
MLSRVHTIFPDVNESAVYALLRGLKKDGFAETYQGQTSAGPARKYYRLTGSGKERYQALSAQWRQLAEAMREMGVE